VHAQAQVRWRLASSFPKSLDTLFGAADVFAKKLSDMSGGKFTVSTHAAGELMPAFGVVDGVQNATVECAHTAPYYFFGKDETFALGLRDPVRPQLAPDDGLDVRGQRPQADARVLPRLQHHQLPGRQHRRADGRLVPQGDQDAGRHQGSEDAHRRLRGRVLERMGGVPQNLPGGEIYQALEKGTIDAAEWVGPYDDQSSASTRSRRTTTTPAGGKAARSWIS
jgi:hypothetical protein